MIYTCWGSVRGCCGQVHTSTEEAIACIGDDHDGCKGQGGYSDRHVRVIKTEGEIKNYDVTKGPGQKLE